MSTEKKPNIEIKTTAIDPIVNLPIKFRISGLGQLIEAGIQADRMITFGD